MLVAIALLIAAEAVPTASGAVEPDPRTMTRSEIRTHNASLVKGDPLYIRCEREAEVGSLVPRKPTCRTNRQWAALEQANRDQIRGLGSDLTTRSASSGSN